MDEKAKLKSTAGRLLANLRWSKATEEERIEAGRKMAAGRKKARKAKKALR